MLGSDSLSLRMLKDDFRGWVEPDDALYLLAKGLGMLPEGSDPVAQFRELKWVWCSNNAYSERLWDMLEAMVAMGFMEKGDDQGDLHNCFRWVAGKSFDG